MIVLGLDATTTRTSAALFRDGGGSGIRLDEAASEAPRAASETLLALIGEALAAGDCRLEDLDAIAVARGPGMFTGIRMALATAQGLAAGADIPLVGVSSLAALVLDAASRADVPGRAAYLGVLDARKEEIYSGWYVVPGDGDTPLALLDEESLTAAAAVRRPAPTRFTGPLKVVGPGAALYGDVLSERLGLAPADLDPGSRPTAGAVAQLGAHRLARGATAGADEVLPVYLRPAVD